MKIRSRPGPQALNIPMSSFEEDIGVIFEIGESVQNHNNNNDVNTSNFYNNSELEMLMFY